MTDQTETQPTAHPITAVLLIAHGSSQAKANDDLFQIAGDLRERGPFMIVEGAFLELSEPTIEKGGEKCVEQGADCVLLVPYFLSAGVHAREDLTSFCERLGKRFPEVEFRLARPLGPHPLLVEIVMERAREIAP